MYIFYCYCFLFFQFYTASIKLSVKLAAYAAPCEYPMAVLTTPPLEQDWREWTLYYKEKKNCENQFGIQ